MLLHPCIQANLSAHKSNSSQWEKNLRRMKRNLLSFTEACLTFPWPMSFKMRTWSLTLGLGPPRDGPVMTASAHRPGGIRWLCKPDWGALMGWGYHHITHRRHNSEHRAPKVIEGCFTQVRGEGFQWKWNICQYTKINCISVLALFTPQLFHFLFAYMYCLFMKKQNFITK